MIRQRINHYQEAALRASLRRKIKGLYQSYNREDWRQCYLSLDPRLRDLSKATFPQYAKSLQAFKRHYGAVNIWYVRTSLHLDAQRNKHDGRPFAYVYILWQDDAKAFHLFRERWVHDSGRWYTRVVGLVAHERK